MKDQIPNVPNVPKTLTTETTTQFWLDGKVCIIVRDDPNHPTPFTCPKTNLTKSEAAAVVYGILSALAGENFSDDVEAALELIKQYMLERANHGLIPF